MAPKILRAAEKALRQRMAKASGRQLQLLKEIYEKGGWVLSRDNATCHATADLSAIGISTDELAPLASCSGDMHLIIEHIHGLLDGLMGNWMLANPGVTDMPTLIAKLEELFFANVTPKMVEGDFGNMVQVWKDVRDAKGGYAPHKHRCGAGLLSWRQHGRVCPAGTSCRNACIQLRDKPCYSLPMQQVRWRWHRRPSGVHSRRAAGGLACSLPSGSARTFQLCPASPAQWEQQVYLCCRM